MPCREYPRRRTRKSKFLPTRSPETETYVRSVVVEAMDRLFLRIPSLENPDSKPKAAAREHESMLRSCSAKVILKLESQLPLRQLILVEAPGRSCGSDFGV